ncbi:sialidase family protein [Rhizobium sp. S163]|uniref:sialidase family protein n=1 Tax=Rhizobium sp. S163 TaxID=3055039 RepID=UPI0025A9984C|nr:sialidase family protein [Rhizobium sp. S163]MDM9644875.1 sialidase family protein [Rhizobium sp. S163]
MTGLATHVAGHQEVFRRPGHFSAWPANYGLWVWEDEVVVVFADGRLGEQGALHARDKGHHFRPLQARSADGGQTWSVEPFAGFIPGGGSLSADEHVAMELRSGGQISDGEIEPLSMPIDFKDPEVAVMVARTGLDGRARSWFYVTRNRGRGWEGPFNFTGLDVEGLASRTDVVPLSGRHALFMMTASKEDGTEGCCLCAETTDGGLSFRRKSVLPFDGDGYAIMPSSVRLPDGSILSVVRRGKGVDRPGWLEAFRSENEGATWQAAGIPVADTGIGGNPGSLALLEGKRLAIVYGYRGDSPGIRMVTSSNGGRDWSESIDIRRDAKLPDIGYPRSVVLRDGRLLAVYYYNFGRERFIAASIISVA